ncbi:MAG: response regulator transcription factor [Chloroflexi bacterium]|nr:response regulator transcription factor [Chloroflexota bacterium]
MTSIRVAIVDDQTLLREGLAVLLGLIPDLEVVGQAGDGRAALEMVNDLAPEVVLMDIRMPGMNGVATTRQIMASHPETRVIVLTTFDDDEYVFEALQAGAAGYLLKTADPYQLAAAIRDVYEGKSILDPAITQKVIRRAKQVDGSEPVFTERLTSRERDVLRLMAEGRSNGEIAQRLSLSEGTVKNHVSRILAKLEARDRAHASRLAAEWGLL